MKNSHIQHILGPFYTSQIEIEYLTIPDGFCECFTVSFLYALFSCSGVGVFVSNFDWVLGGKVDRILSGVLREGFIQVIHLYLIIHAYITYICRKWHSF